MKNKKWFYFILLAAIILSIVSYSYLSRTPVSFFILKAETNHMGAFKIDVYLNRHFSTITSLNLNGAQQTEGTQAISSKSIYQLQSLASRFGQFDFVIGVSSADEDINSFWNRFLNRQSPAGNINNLNALDQLYLTLIAGRKLSAQNLGETTNPVETLPVVASTPASTVQLKKAVSESIVRVEILNGCGIKGAADWVASRIAGPTIMAINGGNAKNFKYAKSELLLSKATFPDLEKALITLGFSQLNNIRSNDIPVGCDAILIVGKNFQRIREK